MIDERSAESESRATGEGHEPTQGGMSSRTPPPSPDSPGNDGAASTREEEQIQKDITDLLSDVERERDEYLELAKRTKADFENYRRRVAGEAQEAERRGRAALVRELLPVIDSLERALKAAGEGEGSLHEGVKLVLDEFESVLRRSGVESYEPAGEQFDPEWHEAMMTRPSSTDDAGKVVEVLEKGYRQNGQVIRPARVVVGAANG